MKTDFFFKAESAKKYGVVEATVLHHLVFWVHKNALNKVNNHEGKVWTYNSVKAFTGIFTFLSADQVRRVLRNLEKKGAIEVGSFNKLGFDRTKWYTITAEAASIYGLELPQHGFSGTTKSIRRNAQMDLVDQANQYQVNNTGDQTQVNYPWPDDGFKDAWDVWLQERKAHKRSYKTTTAQQRALNMLFKDTNGSLELALETIDRAIAAGWQGLHVNRPKQQRGFNQAAVDLNTVHSRAHQWSRDNT